MKADPCRPACLEAAPGFQMWPAAPLAAVGPELSPEERLRAVLSRAARPRGGMDASGAVAGGAVPGAIARIWRRSGGNRGCSAADVSHRKSQRGPYPNLDLGRVARRYSL